MVSKRMSNKKGKGADEKKAKEGNSLDKRLEEAQTPMKLQGLPETTKKILFAYPIRNVDWVKEPWRKSAEPVAILFYPKTFTRFERILHRYIGGPTLIRRPLDVKGTRIWEMCDGKTDVLHICINVDAKYKEDMEPVIPRVLKFLEMLLKRGLLRLLSEPNEAASKARSEKIPEEGGKNVRKVQQKEGKKGAEAKKG